MQNLLEISKMLSNLTRTIINNEVYTCNNICEVVLINNISQHFRNVIKITTFSATFQILSLASPNELSLVNHMKLRNSCRMFLDETTKYFNSYALVMKPGYVLSK